MLTFSTTHFGHRYKTTILYLLVHLPYHHFDFRSTEMDLFYLGRQLITALPSGNGTDVSGLPIKLLEAVVPGYSLFANVAQQWLGFCVEKNCCGVGSDEGLVKSGLRCADLWHVVLFCSNTGGQQPINLQSGYLTHPIHSMHLGLPHSIALD